MGGSGGVFSHSTPEDYQERIRREQERSVDEEFNGEVSTFIDVLLAQYNDRDKETIDVHLKGIVAALRDRIDGAIETLFGGSIDKHTYVDGLSDIDALVLLNDPEVSGDMPNAVLARLSKILHERFPNTDIKIGTLAVTVFFSDKHEVQLLPAIRVQGGFKIPAAKGNKWAEVSPEKFVEKLTRVNDSCGGKVVPTIKLVKAINNGLPKAFQLTGYHMESLAIEAFESYSGRKNTKAMLGHFFSEAASRVLSPIQDKTGQSVHVDEYLGKAGGSKRIAVSRELMRIARRIRNADAAQSLAQWKALFGDLV